MTNWEGIIWWINTRWKPKWHFDIKLGFKGFFTMVFCYHTCHELFNLFRDCPMNKSTISLKMTKWIERIFSKVLSICIQGNKPIKKIYWKMWKPWTNLKCYLITQVERVNIKGQVDYSIPEARGSWNGRGNRRSQQMMQEECHLTKEIYDRENNGCYHGTRTIRVWVQGWYRSRWTLP